MDGDVEVQISALEHFSFCPRQCGLIHLEQTFDENAYTIRGRLVHATVDSGETTDGPDARVLRGIPLWSEQYGLRGRADVVELRRNGPYPIEYKVGPPRGPHASIQLCAQALCLEEMLETSVTSGAVYHHATRQRVEVEFTAELRAQTREVIDRTRALIATSVLPPAPNDARCRHCSIIDSCMPSVTSGQTDSGVWDRDLLDPDGASTR